MSKTETQILIENIKKTGLSLAEIARRMNTSWSMVNYWHKGIHNAKGARIKQLQKMAGKNS